MKYAKFSVAVCAFSATLAGVAPAIGQSRWFASDVNFPVPGEEAPREYGHAVAIDGDVAVFRVDASAIEIRRRAGDQWILEEHISAPNDEYLYGESLAISDDVLVVGAPEFKDQTAVYVYRFNGVRWLLEAQIDPELEELSIGHSVAVDGPLLAFSSDTWIDGSHLVYVYSFRDGVWTLDETLHAIGEYDDNIHATVRLVDDRLFIGSPWFNDFQGAIDVRRRAGDEWNSEAIFVGFEENSDFGHDFDADANRIAAASPRQRRNFVTIYERVGETWTVEQEIDLGRVGNSRSGRGWLGAIALDGDRLIASLPEDSRAESGSIQLFERSNEQWLHSTALVSAIDGYRYGLSADLSGQTVIAGSDGGEFARIALFHLENIGRLNLVGPRVGLAGQVNEWIIGAATPGERVKLVAGRQNGVAFIPGCGQNFVSIDAPIVIGNAIANENGDAKIERLAPHAAAHETFLFQAVEQVSCRTSNVIHFKFDSVR